MADTQAENPFKASQRSTRVRNIVFLSIGILAVLAIIVFYSSSRRSSILISGTTTGFSITLNGQSVGTQTTAKGLVIPVYSGVYRLKIDRPNYLPFQADVTVTAGKQVAVRPTFTVLPSSIESAQDGIKYVRPAADEKAVYYLGDDGQRLYQLEVANQTAIALTDRVLGVVRDVQWSSDPTVTLLVKPDGVYLLEIPKFDFKNQALVKVAGPEAISPIWDPTNPKRIAAAYFNAQGEKSLIITDKRFTQIDRKVDLKQFTSPKLIWSPDGKYILVINHSTSYASNDMWLYDTTAATFDQLTTKGNIVDASFNQDSSVILFERLTGGGNSHELAAYTIAAKKELVLPTENQLSQTAWKNNSAFYTVGINHELIQMDVNGNSSGTSYFFPASLDVKGMQYFAGSGSLVFFSNSAVYTVTLDK